MAEEKNEDRRSFVGPDDKDYFIAPPSANDIKEADWQYSKVYTRSLTEGITTSAEMMDILRRRGIIGPEFEKRASELTTNLNEAIWKLDKAESIDDKRDAAIEVAIARDELFQWNQRLNGPMSNTCEQIADDARLEYLTSCMIVNDAGNRVWSDYDSYLKEKSNAMALKARFEVMLYIQGLDSDFLEKTPEALAMKEVEQDILDKVAEASAALEAMEAEEAAAAEAEKEPETPKKTRKKRTTKKKTAKKEDTSEE